MIKLASIGVRHERSQAQRPPHSLARDSAIQLPLCPRVPVAVFPVLLVCVSRAGRSYSSSTSVSHAASPERHWGDTKCGTPQMELTAALQLEDGGTDATG